MKGVDTVITVGTAAAGAVLRAEAGSAPRPASCAPHRR
jgi:hypothetical protein